MPIAAETETAAEPTLNIGIDKVAFVIVKARQFDAKEADSDPDSGSNATDEARITMSTVTPNSPAYRAESRAASFIFYCERP